MVSYGSHGSVAGLTKLNFSTRQRELPVIKKTERAISLGICTMKLTSGV